jgi:IclR family KDG regulon transcriptional repressor
VRDNNPLDDPGFIGIIFIGKYFMFGLDNPTLFIDHALDVLEAFHGEEDELGITELSRRLKLHKNNIFRILATLESRGYVEQNLSTDNYRLGLRSLELGQTYIRHTGLLRVARPVMEELNRKVNENVYIGILKERYAFYLDVVESNHTVRVLSRVGCRVPTYCSGIGKAQLAYESMENIMNVLGRKELKKFTKTTIADRDRMIEHLMLVKEVGYAVDDEEWDEGVRCVGAPIMDYTRKVVGGLSISAPSVRMTLDKIKKDYVPLIKDACAQISADLGYKPLDDKSVK